MSSNSNIQVKFESVKMSDDETIVEYNTRVLDVVNESFVLGEKIIS